MIKLGIIGTSWITAMFIDAVIKTKAYEQIDFSLDYQLRIDCLQ